MFVAAAHGLGVSALAPKPSATASPILLMMQFSTFVDAAPRCRRLLPSICVALADVLFVVVPGNYVHVRRGRAASTWMQPPPRRACARCASAAATLCTQRVAI